jgi:hypothetical protein
MSSLLGTSLAPFEGYVYHGVKHLDTWDAICRGGGLRLGKHVSDPGDLGAGIYCTTSFRCASNYATFDDRVRGQPRTVLLAKVRLRNALWIDFGKSSTEKRRVADAWYSDMRAAYGPTCRGDWGERIEAARRWRAAYLKDGIDGLVADHWDCPRTVVLFEPERSVLEIRCRRRR